MSIANDDEPTEAYLDIETWRYECWLDLSPCEEISVVGKMAGNWIHQLHWPTADMVDEEEPYSFWLDLEYPWGIGNLGKDEIAERLRYLLPPGCRLYTFNGIRFDLPKIEEHFGIDLRAEYECIDLMHCCRAVDLFGSQKEIEARIGFEREVNATGFNACRLYNDWIKNQKKGSLTRLLKYNAEDLYGMEAIRDHLGGLGVLPRTRAIRFQPHT